MVRLLCLVVASCFLLGCVTSSGAQNLTGPASDPPPKEVSEASPINLGKLFGFDKGKSTNSPGNALASSADRGPEDLGFFTTPKGQHDEVRHFYDVELGVTAHQINRATNNRTQVKGTMSFRRPLPADLMLLTSVPLNSFPVLKRDFSSALEFRVSENPRTNLLDGVKDGSKNRYGVYSTNGAVSPAEWHQHLTKRYEKSCGYKLAVQQQLERGGYLREQNRIISIYECRAPSAYMSTRSAVAMRLSLGDATVHLLYEWEGNRHQAQKRIEDALGRWYTTEICRIDVSTGDRHACPKEYLHKDRFYGQFCGFVTEIVVLPDNEALGFNQPSTFWHVARVSRDSIARSGDTKLHHAIAEEIRSAVTEKPEARHIFRFAVPEGVEEKIVSDSMDMAFIMRDVKKRLVRRALKEERIRVGVNPSCRGEFARATS